MLNDVLYVVIRKPCAHQRLRFGLDVTRRCSLDKGSIKTAVSEITLLSSRIAAAHLEFDTLDVKLYCCSSRTAALVFVIQQQKMISKYLLTFSIMRILAATFNISISMLNIWDSNIQNHGVFIFICVYCSSCLYFFQSLFQRPILKWCSPRQFWFGKQERIDDS